MHHIQNMLYHLQGGVGMEQGVMEVLNEILQSQTSTTLTFL